jgi:hypothetical protein
MVVAAVLANIVFFRYPLARRLSTHDSLARRPDFELKRHMATRRDGSSPPLEIKAS